MTRCLQPGSSFFLRLRRPYVGERALVAGSHAEVVLASRGQAQSAIRPATNDVGILVILPVVLPEADRADLEATSFAECVRRRQQGHRYGPPSSLASTDRESSILT